MKNPVIGGLPRNRNLAQIDWHTTGFTAATDSKWEMALFGPAGMKTANQSSGTEQVEVLILVCPEMLPKVRSVLRGIRSFEAGNLREALRVLGNRPRLLITKVDQDGFELFRTARDYYPEIKVVMLGDEVYGNPSHIGN